MCNQFGAIRSPESNTSAIPIALNAGRWSLNQYYLGLWDITESGKCSTNSFPVIAPHFAPLRPICRKCALYCVVRFGKVGADLNPTIYYAIQNLHQLLD
jgi:hypothetical protein